MKVTQQPLAIVSSDSSKTKRGMKMSEVGIAWDGYSEGDTVFFWLLVQQHQGFLTREYVGIDGHCGTVIRRHSIVDAGGRC